MAFLVNHDICMMFVHIIRFSVIKNIISELKINTLRQIWGKLCHFFYISYVSGGHRGFWKSQAGCRWPPTWNLVFGMVSFRKSIKMIVTKHCKVHQKYGVLPPDYTPYRLLAWRALMPTPCRFLPWHNVYLENICILLVDFTLCPLKYHLTAYCF